MIREKSAGQSASASLQNNGLEFTRVFKLVLENPGDIVDVDYVQAIKSVDPLFEGIGTLHPKTEFAVCDTMTVAPEGDSRMVYTITVSYRPTQAISMQQGGSDDRTPDPGSIAPDDRPANWSTSTTTIEVPSWVWTPQWGPNAGQAVPVTNPAGDLVDGVTILQPIVNITVEQYCAGDQTVFSNLVGQVNANQGRLGSLNLFPRSTLFRGVSFKPHTEMFRDKRWRGWIGTFEFSYKPNFNNYLQEFVGWDIAIPLSGFNIINQFGANVDKGACHLELENDATGAIKNWPNPQIAAGTAGDKMRANVLITTPTDNGTRASQRPSASPVPLNEDGTPRSPKANPPVLVRRYQVYDSFDMTLLGLRFR